MGQLHLPSGETIQIEIWSEIMRMEVNIVTNWQLLPSLRDDF